MNKLIAILATMLMLIPTIASAELNYNSIAVDYSKTTQSGVGDLSGIDIGISKSVYSNVFLTGLIFYGRQASGSALGDLSVYGFSEGAGYHAPINYHTDFIVSGSLQQNKSKLAGSSTSENGYTLGVSLRTEFSEKVEGDISGSYLSMSDNSFTSTGKTFDVKLGYMVTPEFELLADINSTSHNPPTGSSYDTRTMNLGTRFYF
jgi:opacity protein-like surface antigen